VRSLDKQCNTVLGCNGGVNTTMFAPANVPESIIYSCYLATHRMYRIC